MTEQIEQMKGTAYVAARLGQTQDNVRKLARSDQIPHTMLGTRYRFSPSKIEEWIAKGGTKQNRAAH